jgi:hypothetical protein
VKYFIVQMHAWHSVLKMAAHIIGIEARPKQHGFK